MKPVFSFLSLAAVFVTMFSLFFSSCNQPAKPEGEAPANIVESSSICGLWQKESAIAVEDQDTEEATLMEKSSLYKCILPDGTFFLFRAFTDSITGENRSYVELYGTYTMQADTACVETIVNHAVYPELSGAQSLINYKLVDKDLMNAWYNIQDREGVEGCNEWIPEVWHRVAMK